ncbi:helix-turn-helix domain-containing protein [Bordetella sp. BOR01]|uniref:helix-turn-helix domain-containing protein n=1 Tax=Bordetella sp. BOR01 TaxID=2854779 RepID=UPI001C483BF7|nr:XRE family transcriptional regulator [Bordetella sp. BOR01]MBV7481806.1 XRE family transcriptional regulator [Bordetella sp. BOR01]
MKIATAASPYVADGDMLDDVLLGAEVRKLRKARSKSLADLAGAIGRSVSFLSQLERGHAQPSIADLRAIAAELDVPLGWFFVSTQVPVAEHGKVVRAAGRRRLGNTTGKWREELLSPDIGGAFETFLCTFESGARLDKTTLRQTEEEGYVVQGRLDLWIGKRHFLLEAGDSFRIVREPFRWANQTNRDVVVVWVIAPPTY